MNELEIFVLYERRGGAVVPFVDLIGNRDIMDVEDYEIESFWGACGGIRIVFDKYRIIFDSVDFHHLFKIIDFLLHSLYLLNGKDSFGIFSIDEDFPNDVVVKSTAGHSLRLENLNGDTLLLSYKHREMSYARRRGDRFFEGIAINKVAWKSAARIALEEYFSVLLNIVKASGNAPRNRIAMEYYQYWLEVR
ncbi:hypothetical protein [Chitinophaga ginsengisoli]|uniref:Uncharacterized protein n=1 Tax=Chitinophaga ginsengisoli TaxID=363837 RepID=A0A2P8FXN6_9BACT|nr:hypothetical protein [Chitinophaga ginsengisoli]PSL26425.1 hypothetical protein CLV42_111137 [Chitinophaga ginsengisoli]